MTARPLATVFAAGLVVAACAAAPPPRAAPAPPPPARSTLSGASLGAVLGGRRARAEAAATAPVAGDVAAYVGRLEAALRARADASVEVLRQGNNLDLRMSSGAAFDFNAATVRTAFRPVLDRVAQALAGARSTFVDVTGYTDAVGTDAVNQKLSEERAFAVADYLSRSGVARARIATRGLGKAQPVASNADAAGRARNRRVEIHISPIVDDDVRGR